MLPAVNFDSISAQRRTVCRSREKTVRRAGRHPRLENSCRANRNGNERPRSELKEPPSKGGSSARRQRGPWPFTSCSSFRPQCPPLVHRISGPALGELVDPVGDQPQLHLRDAKIPKIVDQIPQGSFSRPTAEIKATTPPIWSWSVCTIQPPISSAATAWR